MTDLRNKTRWLVTHPSLHTPCPSLHTPMRAQTLSDFPWVPADQTFAEHGFGEESTCRGPLLLLCFALSRCRPRYIADTYLVADPTPVRASDPPFCHSCWSCGGALCELRFALPRCRPRYIAATYLVTDPSPARASDPPLALGCCKFPSRLALLRLY